MDIGKTFLGGIDTALVTHPWPAVIQGLVPQVLLGYGFPGPVGYETLNCLTVGVDLQAVTAYVLRQRTAQSGVDGVNKFLTE